MKFTEVLDRMDEKFLNEVTEVQARQRGYSFSGEFSKDIDDAKEMQQKQKQNGNKAIIVNNGYKMNRGQKKHGGYSIYIIKSQKNIDTENLTKKQNTIAQLNTRKKQLEKELEDIEKQLKELE